MSHPSCFLSATPNASIFNRFGWVRLNVIKTGQPPEGNPVNAKWHETWISRIQITRSWVMTTLQYRIVTIDPFCNQRNLIYCPVEKPWTSQSPASPHLSRTWKSKTQSCKYMTISQFSLMDHPSPELFVLAHRISWNPCMYLHVQLWKNRVRCTDWFYIHCSQFLPHTFNFGSAVSTSQGSRTWFCCYWSTKLSASNLDSTNLLNSSH